MPRLVGSDSGWRALAARHAWLLWWIHSLYALALGVVFMWLGARNFTWLRLAALHIVVIWGASLALANVIDRPGRDSIWWGRLRMVVNYVTKNFYQQILFFILPIYYASATAGSRNMAFVVLLAASAVMSTLDIVYDRHLSRRRELNALFFAFNLFAAVAVALPVLWSISNVAALRIASLGAVIGYVTIARQPTDLARPRTWKASAVGAVLLLALTQWLLPYVPPAPLRLTDSQFSLAFDPQGFRPLAPVTSLSRAWTGRVFVVTSLHAPLGLKDAVELRWYRGGRLLWASRSVDVVGGRQQGFRLWSAVNIGEPGGQRDLRVDVVTGAGQLIGRARLPEAGQ
jgi:heme/copper-type cytochrome/quinol oxidase subunit 4